MHQGRGLQRLAWLLVRAEFLSRQPAKLVVDQRQKLLGGSRVAGLDLRQDLRDVGHRSGLQNGRPGRPIIAESDGFAEQAISVAA